MPTEFDKGLLVGLLIGEGHFGGDGRQPQVTLRMHVRHEDLFAWIEEKFPGGRLYGPYDHGGRHYFQWMARGSYLREVIVPLLDEKLAPRVDPVASLRYEQMKAQYRRRIQPAGEQPAVSSPVTGPGPKTNRARPRAPVPPSGRGRPSIEEIFKRLRAEGGDRSDG
ncbi:MAG: hypothetical protein ACRDZX_14130 [Acidimicrobiales bacterium]